MEGTLVCFCVVFFGSHLIMASDSFTVTCADSVMGKYGSSVVLPCWLSPEISAESMEIRWYRSDQFKNPLLFYQNHKMHTPLMEMYINRTSLTSRNPQSTGLKQGDVSLRLDNLGLRDTGLFHCYVSGDTSYQSNFLRLNLTAVGSPPRISLEHHHDSVDLSCSSCGWFPRPRLMWKPTNENISMKSPVYSEKANGLFCVNSSVTLLPSVSNSISCSVTLSEQDKREVSMDIGARQKDDSNGTWKTLFILLLSVLALALIGMAVFFYRKHSTEYKPVQKDEPPKDESNVNMDDLRKSAYESKVNMDDLRKSAVTITFDKENCNKDNLKFNSNIVRDDKYEGPGFPYELCVRGINTFHSGRAYWEVKLEKPNTPTKRSWLIGVTKAPYTISSEKSNFTPLNGFWFLYSDPENGIRVNTEPEISLPLPTMPECIGVLLDFDEHKLSFYSATEGLHLFTMIIDFQGEIVPLFNPGKGDACPLEIVNLQANTQANNQANNEASNQV